MAKSLNYSIKCNEMRHLAILIILFGISAFANCQCHGILNYLSGYYSCETYDEWVLVFEDDFDDSDLDYSIWSNCYPHGRNLFCNNEVQYYSDGDNIVINDGVLELIGKEESVYERTVDWMGDNDNLVCNGSVVGTNKQWFDYTSGMIHSKQDFQYGKFEIRCKIPSIGFTWPAFWLFGDCKQEIDIFEFMSENTNPYFANRNMDFSYHRKDNCDTGEKLLCSTDIRWPSWTTDMSLAFHTYSVEWDEHMLVWRIDGNEIKTVYRWHTILGQDMLKCGQIVPGSYVEDKIFPLGNVPMNIVANFAIKENPTATFPDAFEIDYIRVYQKINSTAAVNICSNTDIKGSTVAGQEIYVGGASCSILVLDGEYLDLTATDKIVINSNFTAELGSQISANVTDQ